MVRIPNKRYQKKQKTRNSAFKILRSHHVITTIQMDGLNIINHFISKSMSLYITFSTSSQLQFGMHCIGFIYRMTHSLEMKKLVEHENREQVTILR